LSIRSSILSEISEVAAQQNRKLAPLTDDLNLINSGLDSLCFAILIARLEDKLQVDPFSQSDDIYYPVTLGDFIRCYEDAKP
jgi:acyl carrier protein